MRPNHIVYDSKTLNLYASTNRGTILKFDSHLNLIATSEPVYNLGMLYVIIQDEDYIYGREITGKLIRWRKSDLHADHIVDLTAWSSPEVADVPNVSHGLFFYGDSVYVSMPQGPLGRFKKSNLEFLGLSSFMPKALIESVETHDPEAHFAVDFSGQLYKGHIDREMKPISKISNGATHRLVYDEKHSRYWTTDDHHCGLALFKADNPTSIQRIDLSNDDVEWLSFSHDHSEVLVACFDRYVYRLKNDVDPYVTEKIGPLKYQVKQVVWADPTFAFALTESGEIYFIDLVTGKVKVGPTGTNCVWDIHPIDSEASKFWVAFEDGFVRKIQVQSTQIHIIEEKQLNLGMVRRLKALKDGGVVVLAVNGFLARLDEKLNLIWSHKTQGLLRDFAICNDSLLFAGETGEISALNVLSGQPLWQRHFDQPFWSISIDPQGKQFYASPRVCNREDQGKESSGQPAYMHIGNVESGEIQKRHPIHGNVKKISWIDNETLMINGNGEVAISWLHREDLTVIRRWTQFQLNTYESTLHLHNFIYATTYGFQLNTYHIDGEILESSFPFEDYSTSLVKVGSDMILAGGRGAFLSLFRLQKGLPIPLSTKRFL